MISRNLRDIILHRVNIQKVSQIYPLQGGYPESFRIINSYTAFSYLLGLHLEAVCGVLDLLQRFKEVRWHSTT